MEIKFFSRISNKVEIEKVYGDKMVEWLYQTNLGKMVSPLLTTAPLSVIYGELQNLSLSKNKIPNFIKNFHINMDDYLPEDGRDESDPYSNFNQFFIRKFKNGKRTFTSNESEMSAFAEARYFGYEKISSEETIPVKGKYLTPAGLIANKKWDSTFLNGPLLLARLCPVDYHRFHFPLDGKVVDNYRVKGEFHSVNPIALKAKEDILIKNERHVTILETKDFGKLAYVEVGAICVGKIIQSNDLNSHFDFKRGDEKGYFLFGGSTVIVVGEEGRWTPSFDIVNNTKKGIETYIQLGMTVATKG